LAGMVHPSTGFMVAKTLLSVRSLVDTLAEELQAGAYTRPLFGST
jgi:lycopene beta-cyclase